MNKFVTTIVILTIISNIVSCCNTEELSTEMEIYYFAHGDLFNIYSYKRHIIIRADSSFCNECELGDSIPVLFIRTGDKLEIAPAFNDSIMNLENSYYFKMYYKGKDQESGRCMFGKRIFVSEEEYNSAKMISDSTKIARVYFKPSKKLLRFSRLEVVKIIPGRPRMTK